MINTITTFSGISVNNIKEAREFYVDKLGLNLTDDSMGLNLDLPGGGKLFVYDKPDHQPATFTVLNFVVANIDDAIEELKSSGIDMERYDLGPDIQQDEKGVLRGLAANMGPDIAWFNDPAGNVLAVLQDS